MAQLSTNTIFYDQLIKKIQNFLIKYTSNEISTYEEISKEFNSLLTEVNKYSTDPIAKYNQFAKGEPPSSKKMNNFISDVADDLNIAAKQLDYQSAQVVSLYNLFNSEIQKENQFINRIKSKVKTLQIYSEAPSEDLYYFGDSFENMDFIDIEKTSKDLIPVVNNGRAFLPVAKSNVLTPRSISIDENLSNVFIGNNHSVYAKKEIDTDYRYVFQDNKSIGLLQNITDSNPLTYFECEGIYIDPIEKNKNGAKSFEFTYAHESLIDGKKTISYKNWSDKNINEPLIVNLVIKYEVVKKINFLTILPYFSRN